MDRNVFEYVILVFILISSIHLVLDTPLVDPNSNYARVLSLINLVVTAIFSLEAVLKILAYGLITNGPRSYFRSIWNILDFTIVLFSVNIFFKFVDFISLLTIR